MSTTITSLLNSLQSHLQSQTQLLPTLHNQLGLPPTALTDELAILQKQLTECVESQIEVRRKQVDDWMGRCDEVENRCIRYGKALGSHVKATGSSVGEIRKEQVLPRRFDMINEYQEKLRQMYHTKLEQLQTLTNRLTALSRTLGPEYYQDDVLEPVLMPGEDELDPEAYRDVTPERFSKLEKEVMRGKGEVNKRLHHLSNTFIQIDYLYTELGILPPTLDDLPSPSTSSGLFGTRPPLLCGSMATSSNSSDPFLATSTRATTPTPMARGKSSTPFLLFSGETAQPQYSESDYQRVFAHFALRLEELSDEELQDPTKPSVGLEGVDPTPGLVSWAERICSELEEIKRRRESQIQAMYDQLEALWKRLGVPDSEMDEFVESNRGTTEATIRAYEAELDRMLELKREKMSTFVENARAEITKLWDDLMVGAEERADFAPFADDEHTEELLAIHEEEIRRLKEERKLKGSLLISIKKWFDICQEEKELAAAASDQTRLLGRGPRDPGRLLREEKMRKRVTKEKPRLEQDLLASVPAWETEACRTFLVNGESVLQLLLEASATSEKEKENTKRKTRAGSVPARSKTPSGPTPSTSGSGQGRSSAATPAVRPASSMGVTRSMSMSTKRAKLGESTNSSQSGPSSTTRRTRSTSKALRPPSPPHPPSTLRPTAASLPRSTSIATPVPRHGVLGIGRAPSSHQSRSRNYHPYPQTRRPTPAATTVAAATAGYAAMGGIALNSGLSAGAVRKASRARRESFKPRPSMDDDWGAPAANDGPKRFAGFAGGAVQEVEEDF